MWFELIVAGTPPEKIDWQPNATLVRLWAALKPEQQFRPALPALLIPDVLPAPVEASGIQSFLGCVPPKLLI